MSTALERKEPRPVDIMKVELLKPAFQAWLQKQMAASMNRNADQLVRIFLQACIQNDYLAKCTPHSVLSSLCLAAQIGLAPNTALGHAWLVPFANSKPPARRGGQWTKVVEAQLIVGYQGFVKLAYDAAGIVTQAQAVYHGDDFDYDLASFPPVKFHRRGKAKDRGPLIHSYCLGKTPQGLVFGDVLDRSEVEARRAVSKSYLDKDTGIPRKDSPWVTHEAAMWMKTAVRDTLKLFPKGNDERLERAIEVDDMDTREQGSISGLVDFNGMPYEGPLDGALDGSEPGQLAPMGDDATEKIKAEFATCDSMKALDEVAAKIPPELRSEELNRSYCEHSDRLRGGNGKKS